MNHAPTRLEARAAAVPRTRVRMAVCALALMAAGAALANGRVYSSGPKWEASTDGQNWIPAYAPYPNDFTVPVDTLGQLMWYWDRAGTPSGSDGENSARFRISRLKVAPLSQINNDGAWIAADDWMELFVNGHSAATYLLDQHQRADGQPMPMWVNFAQWLNRGDQDDNVFEIHAHDGFAPTGASDGAQDRVFEWVFFDMFSEPTRDPASFFAAVPTPSVPALLVAALVAAGLARARRQA